MFTDYYAEASCTAGRANFITGEIPLRTGLTTVGQAGADVGMPAQACTLATALKAQGYATGQFGKNHLGDLNKYLPTLHGFDEFFGYLYHLDAMSDPYWYSLPPGLDSTSTARATWCTAGRRTRMTPPRCRAGARSASRRSWMKARCAPFPDMSNVPELADRSRKAKYDMDDLRRRAGQEFLRLHGQGQEGRQAVLRLAQHDAHARLHVPPAEVPGDDELPRPTTAWKRPAWRSWTTASAHC